MMTVFVLDILLLIILLILGLPIVFCFSGALLFFALFFKLHFVSLLLWGFSKITNPVLLCIPLFILAGGIMSKSGISDALLDFVNLFIGRIKGGLGLVAIITCGIIGAISGSSATGVSAIGPILMPRMVKEGYSRGYSTALVTCSSVLGLLIPPSILMIIYGWTTGTSILACFLATIGPGLLIILFFSITNLISVRKMPLILQQQSPLGFKENMKKKLNTTYIAIPALLMPVIILGGIYGGVFTPGEAAGVAAVISIPIGFLIYRGLKIKTFLEIVKESGTITGSIMIQIFMALILSQVFVMFRIPQELINFIYNITSNKLLILFIINIFLFLQGCVMDDCTSMILSSALMFPMIKELGINPIHFAAILGTNLAMGNLTPPFAPLLYLGMRVCKVEFIEIFKPTLVFIIFGYLPVVIITTYWPALSLFLPRLLGYTF